MKVKKKQLKAIVLSASLVLVGLMMLNSCKKSVPAVAAGSDVVKATVEGTNFCSGCVLKKAKGAGAQCSIFGHKHALKVNKAVGENGKELPYMPGLVLYYLETEKSQELINTHHGEKITAKGKVYPQERILEVDSFEETDSAGPAKTEKTLSAAIEQTTCPVMGGAINKNIFTEYKGKKVYFCCAGCEQQFKKDPEKYAAKLPQFKN